MNTELLAELIRRKHATLVKLRELARRQIDLLGEGEEASLLALLSVKQELLEELQETDRRLDPFREQDPESRSWGSREDRRRCQEMSQECQALLGEIMLLEQHSETDLRRRQDAASERLQGVHCAEEARHAYARTAAVAAGQFNLSTEG